MSDSPRYVVLPHSNLRRAVDIVLAGTFLAPGAVAIGVAAAAIKLTTGESPWFNQERYGEGGKIFVMHKLTTMKPKFAPDGRELADAERHTKLGKILRRLSIDELPQLINVLKGQMTFVGPRPMWVEVDVKNVPNWAERCAVRPGLTGVAQLYPNAYAMSLEERFKIDAEYVREVRREAPFLIRIGHEAGIIAQTVMKVLSFGRKDTTKAMDYGAKRPEASGSAKPGDGPKV